MQWLPRVVAVDRIYFPDAYSLSGRRRSPEERGSSYSEKALFCSSSQLEERGIQKIENHPSGDVGFHPSSKHTASLALLVSDSGICRSIIEKTDGGSNLRIGEMDSFALLVSRMSSGLPSDPQ